MTANRVMKISEATLLNNQLSVGAKCKEGDKGDEGGCNNIKQ